MPVLRFLREEVAVLKERAKGIVEGLPNDKVEVSVEETLARPGGGTMPRSEFPSVAIKLVPKSQSVPKLARSLRLGKTALVGYTTDDALILDLRTIFPESDPLIKAVLEAALS